MAKLQKTETSKAATIKQREKKEMKHKTRRTYCDTRQPV